MAISLLFDKTPQIDPTLAVASHFHDGKFHNTTPVRGMGLWEGLASMPKFFFGKSPQAEPDHPVDVLPLTEGELANAPDASLWRLGHSTVLIKLEGKFWLTDPVFAERASPFSFIGPKRFSAPVIALDELPAIEAVILSHDHYDHLDKNTVMAIAHKVNHFVTPLGVGERLIGWGIDRHKVQQLDWWQAFQIGDVRLIATPSRHFSGRSLSDRDRTLWSSWVMVAPTYRIFFGGDSGYFDGFKQIGDRFGPFDVTLIENGAYDPAWADIHMQPEETVQAHLDLRGKWLVPIHNGTFDLAMHAWTEPMERIATLAKQRHVEISTPRFGERLSISEPMQGIAWWHDLPASETSQLSHNVTSKIVLKQG